MLERGGNWKSTIFGGICHFPHKEGDIGVFIFNDNYEGPVETDDRDLRQGHLTQATVPGSFCHFVIEGQYGLLHSL